MILGEQRSNAICPRAKPGREVTRETFSFQVDMAKLKAAQQRDGHLLRSNLTGEDPAVLWTRYVQLTQIESVFRSLKSCDGSPLEYERRIPDF